MGEIDFTKSALEIERLIRGLNPWPSAYTAWEDKTLKIWKASIIEDSDVTAKGIRPGEAGTVVQVSKDKLYVQTGRGFLSLEEVQLEGKKRMDTAAFLRGNSLEEGTRLGRA